jgi:hypothetical protein
VSFPIKVILAVQIRKAVGVFSPEILIFFPPCQKSPPELFLFGRALGASSGLVCARLFTNMAPIKRKGTAAEDASSAQKRARVGADDRKQNQKKQNTGDAPKASELTVLREDEPSFPRGGGSVLTPLERKQIQIQATKDVLFEQKGAKGPSADFEDGDQDEDAEMEDVDDTTTTKKSRKRKSKGKKDAKADAKEKGVRVEGLNFKVRSIFAIPGKGVANKLSASFRGLWY